MTALASEVAAALERSIVPVVTARGGAVRLSAVQDGIVTLEVTGSPGAVFPLASRIEALVRAAVPAITGVRLVTPGGGQAGSAPEAGGDLAGAARRILDAEINPAISAHRGRVTVAGLTDGWIALRLEGGCQGCSLAEVTIRQGIEPLLRARLPGLTGVRDVTDHQAGTEPFFSPEKR